MEANGPTQHAEAEPARRRLRTERDRYVALAFCWADLLFELDSRQCIAFAAGATEVFLGRSAESLTGAPFADVVIPDDVQRTSLALKVAQKRGRVEGIGISLRRAGGVPMPAQLVGYAMDRRLFVAIRTAARSPDTAPAMVADRPTESGLQNKERFSQSAGEKIRMLSELGEDVELVYLALENFEALRDRVGETGGEALMAALGEVVRDSAVDADLATELDGGRFGVVKSMAQDVKELEGRLREVAKTFDPAGEGVAVSSAAMELATASGLEPEDLSRGLLYSMNRFQEASGGAFDIQHLSMNLSEMVQKGVEDVAQFRSIVAKSAFNVALQPIIDINTGAIHHYEALCRFDKGGPGESPFRYITMAEEIGLIHEFDIAMASKVMGWLRNRPVNNETYNVAVNISGFSIGVESYVTALKAMLKANEWSRGRIMFEITESSRMSDLEAANAFIQELRGMGHHVCLDDFGAGAASFQYLSALEVDVVKIDGSAVRNAMKAPKGRAFLSALTELCARLGVETIAEMIDSPEALRFVRSCGCDYVQGFLFGRPSQNLRDFAPLPNGDLFTHRGKKR